MRKQTISYRPGSGWSSPLPALDGPSTLVVVSADPDVEGRPGVIADVVDAFPTSVVIGCAAAEDATGPVSEGAVTVGVVAFDSTLLLGSVVHVTEPADNAVIGSALARALDRTELGAVLVLADGNGIDGSAVGGELAARLGTSAAVSGRFDRSWVLAGGSIVTSTVVAVGMYGASLDVGRLGIQSPALFPADQTYRDVTALTAVSEGSRVRRTAMPRRHLGHAS